MKLPAPRFFHLRRAFYTSSAALLLASLQTAPAYSLEGVHWPAGATVTFQNALGDAGRTLIDGNTSWAVAADPAGAIWNQSINLHINMVDNPGAQVSQGDHINSIAFASTFFGSSFGTGTLAITGYEWSNSNTLTEADILFNNHQSWDSYRGPLRFGSNGYAIGEIRRVLIHEMGHALGLAHPDQANPAQHVQAVMNSVISDIDTAAGDDVAGGRALYGSAGPTPTPTPTPSPTPSPTPNPTPTPTPSPTPTPNPTPSPTPTPTPVSTPSVSISVTVTSLHTGQAATFTFFATSPASTPLTVNYRHSGSGILGSNYSLSGSPGIVVIPAGSSSASVTLTVLNAPRKKAKTAILVVSPGVGYDLALPSSSCVSMRK